MANKDIVKKRYPQALAEKYKTNGFFSKTYWLIWDTWKRSSPNRSRLGEGDTEAKAWKDALENIKISDQ